jgi:hypothetical protein
VICLFCGTLARLYQFGLHPEWLNQDEALAGYEAFSLLQYGVDMNNHSNPMHFTSVGSGFHALFVYLLIPFVYCFDLDVVSIRLPMLVAHLIALPLFYLTLYHVSNQKIAIIGLSLYSISPMGIMNSRWALDCNLFPVLVLAGLFFLSFFIKHRCNISLVLSSSFFSLCLYSYGVSYLVVPIFLCLCLLYFLIFRKLTLKALLYFCITGMVLSAPAFAYIFINLYDFPTISTPFFTIPNLPSESRFETVSLLGESSVLEEATINFRQYLHILLKQNDGLIWNSFGHHGMTYFLTRISKYKNSKVTPYDSIM